MSSTFPGPLQVQEASVRRLESVNIYGRPNIHCAERSPILLLIKRLVAASERFSAFDVGSPIPYAMKLAPFCPLSNNNLDQESALRGGTA